MRWMVLALLICAPMNALYAAEVSEQEQRQALSNAANMVEHRYVKTDMVEPILTELNALVAAIDGPVQGSDFADFVTERLRIVSGDGHLGLSYSEQPIVVPSDDEQLTLNDNFERWYGAGVNHGVEKIERLDGNIMLFDLRAFPPSNMGGDVIAAAMNTIAQGDALIIDLRRNGGGADTVALIMGYLTAPGSPFMSNYNRPENKWTHQSVPDWVPGRRFGEEKPLYVLISNRTFSAAEALAYSLQAMGRATIIGEQSGGGAHPFEYRKISSHFAIDLPENTSRHPLTGTNWQGTGVTPDVPVPEADALQTAIMMARQAITNQSASGSDLQSLP